MITLRPYQEDAVEAVLADFKAGIHQKTALVLPTGGGKTICTGIIFKRVLEGFKKLRGATIVFIAHREELIAQTMETFQNLGIACSRWTADKKDLSGQVIVAMIQSSRGLPNALEEADRTVVLEAVDEGHHHAADSYQQRSYSLGAPKTMLITATPIRADGVDLGIEKISYQISFVELVKQGYLSKPQYHLIRIRGGGRLRSGGEDYKREDLEKLDNRDRNLIIAQDYQDNQTKYGNALCFCVNVGHCYSLRSAYETLMPDLRTAVVTGDMPKPQRKAVVDLFRSGDIDVLFNVNVFTEGTDVPTINTIQIARPTKSPVLWMQMVGRGCRIHEESGKDSFIIADYADTENNYAWLADGFAQDLLGVPPDDALEIIRAEQDFVNAANDWLKEEGSSKRLKKQLEVIELAGILMLRNRQGKEKRIIVRKKHKVHIDNFWNYFLSNPPLVGTVMQGYVEGYMRRCDPSLFRWPGKHIMNSLGWCLYGFYIARKGEGKPWAIFKPVPDFDSL